VLCSVCVTLVSRPARADAIWSNPGGYCGAGGCPDVGSACQAAANLIWAGNGAGKLLSIEMLSIRAARCWVIDICCQNITSGDVMIMSCPAGTRGTTASASDCVPGIERNPRDHGPMCSSLTENNGNPPAGNPMSIKSGNKFQQFVDFDSGGARAFQFVRYYNSGLESPGVLGFNWMSNFHRAMALKVGSWSGPYELWVVRAGGQHLHFHSTDIFNSVFAPESDNGTKLVWNGTNYVFTDEDDSVETYSRFGVLLSRNTRDGFLLTFGYTNGFLTSVSTNDARQLTFSYQDGKLVSMTTPEGQVVTYQYDAGRSIPGFTFKPDRLSAVTFPDDTPGNAMDNPKHLYHYEDVRFPYQLTGFTDERGIRYATWTYDTQARVTSSVHAGGADLTTIAYNDVDNSRAVTNALGKQATYRFSTVHGRLKLTRVDGQASTSCPAASAQIAYDANGFVSQRIDWNGNVTNYVKDTRGRETSRTEAFGTPQARTITTTWHATLNAPTQIDQPGRRSTFTYSPTLAHGQPLTRTETDLATNQSRTWTYTYHASGQLASVDGPRSDVTDTTAYAYDASNRLQSVTNALGHVTQVLTTDAAGRVTRVRDPNAAEIGFTYDARGRLTSWTKYNPPFDAVATFEWDGAGNLTGYTMPQRTKVTLVYDDARRLIRRTNTANQKIEWSYDGLGNVTAENTYRSTGVLARKWTRDYDELGRLLRHKGAANQTTAYAYDNNGNVLTVTDPLNRVTTMVYDALNRLKQETDPLSGVTQYAYDARDNVTAVTDPKGVVTTNTYDGFDELLTTASADIGTETFEYDAAGNMTRRVEGRGIETTFAYDALNRMTARQYTAAPAENNAYTYDDATPGRFGIGRLSTVSDALGLTRYAYDNRGNVEWEQRTEGAQVYLTRYSHDRFDAELEITYPSGRVVRHVRDGEGRVTQVRWRENASSPENQIIDITTFWPFGPAWKMELANGLSWNRPLDLDYRETGRTLGTVQNLALGYNAASNITSRTDSVTPARSETFGYDALDRMSSATGVYGSLAYGYDANGNRTSRTLNGVTDTYTYAANTNRLQTVANPSTTRTLTQTASGELLTDDRGIGQTFAFVHDSERRLKSLSANAAPIASYGHDGLGRRVRKALPDGTHRKYVYDLDGRLIAERNELNQPVRETIFVDGHPVAEMIGTPGSTTIRYIHTDHIGLPRLMTDASGAVIWDSTFMPFGEQVSASGSTSTDHRFQGQYADAHAGLYYNYFRDYDPTLGRYIQSDPIGLAGGLNRSGYVDGKPLALIDPKGTMAGPGDLVIPAIGLWIVLTSPPAQDAAKKAVKTTANALTQLCPVQDDCTELLTKIKNHMAVMNAKYADMTKDPYDLFHKAYSTAQAGPLGRFGTYLGHVGRYEGLRAGLQKMVQRAEQQGCPVPPEAYEILSRPAPLIPML
jgi:RHS repeat-associated protein